MIAMRHRRSFATHLAAAFLLAGACAAAVPAAESPSPPDRQSLVAGLDVLVIGDSNTEIGHVTGGLSKIFEERHGYFGSGYHSLNDTIGMGSGYLPYLSIENVGRWQKLAMVQPGAPKPYAAPDGSFVIGDEAGAHTNVRFWGDGVTVYWLADGAGGEFTAAVDGGELLNVEARFETAAWPDRLGLIFAARPGQGTIHEGEASFGKIGGGFGLTGTNDLVVPHEVSLDPEHFTLELWVFVPEDKWNKNRGDSWLVCKNRDRRPMRSPILALQKQ
jgi:hypothetical protein